MSHKVSYKWIRRTQYITELGGDYKEVGFYLGFLVGDLRLFKEET